ncbi:MAG: MFS transporter [Clostridiales bacterium]|nr:MFS transporter [Clostridiales bacterium]
MNISKRNKWSYSIGGIGRDMMFIMVSMFTLSYIQYTMKLTVLQFSAVSGIMILARVWDGINDPMMGMIIENSKMKSGKFRPWILIGGVSNFIATILLFTIRPDGWLFVIFFGVVYITWGMTFTINDISYWSLLPNLAKDNDTRNGLTNLILVFASIGQFLAGGLIPVLVTGNAVMMYRVVGVSVSFIFLGFTSLTYFGVQENPRAEIITEKVTVKKMFQILLNNDQLVVMTVALLLHTIASEIFVAFGLNFFYFEFGYGGEYLTIFTVIFALGTLTALGLFSLLVKIISRSRIMTLGVVCLTIGYSLFFLNGIIFEMSLAVLYISGFLAFFGIGLFYVTMIVMTANTIEYNEYLTGHRNESIIFSVRPLMTKIGAALQQSIVTLILITSGVVSLTSEIADLEIKKSEGLITDVTSSANAILETGTTGMKMAIRFGMAIVPLICIWIAFILIKNKYIIDEVYFEEITKKLEAS